jgi:hypothetical protein
LAGTIRRNDLPASYSAWGLMKDDIDVMALGPFQSRNLDHAYLKQHVKRKILKTMHSRELCQLN